MTSNKICTSSLFLFLMLLFVITESCRKGENDPFFSIYSRKSRITGSWRLKDANWQKNDTTLAFTDSLLIMQYNNQTDTLPMQHQITFYKDNTYTEEIITSYPSNWNANGAPAYKLTQTNIGIWKFTGGGDRPLKSQLVLLITQQSVTASNTLSNVEATEYEGQPNGFIYNIDRLSKNELTLTYNLVATSPGSTSTNAGKLNFTSIK